MGNEFNLKRLVFDSLQELKKTNFFELDENDKHTLLYNGLYASNFNQGYDVEVYKNLNLNTFDYELISFVNSVGSQILNEEKNWTIESINGNNIVLVKDNLRLQISRERLTKDPIVGQQLVLKLPSISAHRLPGFIVRLGRKDIPNSAQLGRLYINISVSQVPLFIINFGNFLDANSVAFTMKVFSHPSHYYRFDSCVIYFNTDVRATLLEKLFEFLQMEHVKLLDNVPLLTLKIGVGIGYAEEVTDVTDSGISYGQWISKLFYDSLPVWKSEKDLLSTIKRNILRQGRSPDKPYKNNIEI